MVVSESNHRRVKIRKVLYAHGCRHVDELPLGKIIAVANLDRILTSEAINASGKLSDQERAFGDYSSNRFGWMLSNIIKLENPIPARGMQGLWEFDMSGITGGGK